ncbi:MAG: SDR family oxidoreductase [Bacteroidales bacterium]|nr:SDR family oxidoreductase [Bacteroidales bacterium]
MNWKDKTVWIVGASSGIGEALAYELAKKEARIILSSRKEESLKAIREQLLHWVNFCEVLPLDLEQNSDYVKMVSDLIAKVNKIDVLIINGGISQRSLVLETSGEVDRRIMEVNYFGNIAIAKAVLPYMLKAKSGHIMTVSSIVGKFGFPLRSAYSASKHALHGFYETLRAEYQHQNIKVTIAIPGRVRTQISINALNKEGQAHGEMDPGQATGISAEKCAKDMIKAIEKNKKEVLIGGKELLMVNIRRFLPSLYYKMVTKIEAK